MAKVISSVVFMIEFWFGNGSPVDGLVPEWNPAVAKRLRLK